MEDLKSGRGTLLAGLEMAAAFSDLIRALKTPSDPSTSPVDLI